MEQKTNKDLMDTITSSDLLTAAENSSQWSIKIHSALLWAQGWTTFPSLP